MRSPGLLLLAWFSSVPAGTLFKLLPTLYIHESVTLKRRAFDTTIVQLSASDLKADSLGDSIRVERAPVDSSWYRKNAPLLLAKASDALATDSLFFLPWEAADTSARYWVFSVVRAKTVSPDREKREQTAALATYALIPAFLTLSLATGQLFMPPLYDPEAGGKSIDYFIVDKASSKIIRSTFRGNPFRVAAKLMEKENVRFVGLSPSFAHRRPYVNAFFEGDWWVMSLGFKMAFPRADTYEHQIEGSWAYQRKAFRGSRPFLGLGGATNSKDSSSYTGVFVVAGLYYPLSTNFGAQVSQQVSFLKEDIRWLDVRATLTYGIPIRNFMLAYAFLLN